MPIVCSSSLIARLAVVVLLGSLVSAQDIFSVGSFAIDGDNDTVGSSQQQTQHQQRQKLILDVTSLGASGTDFYDRPFLELQLGTSSQAATNNKVYTRVLGNSANNMHFVGESDSGDTLQLMRYTSHITGRQVLVGSLVELDTQLIYQFQQSQSSEQWITADSDSNHSESDRTQQQQQKHQGQEKIVFLEAIVTPEQNFPESAEPLKMDDVMSETLLRVHKEEDLAYFAAHPTNNSSNNEVVEPYNDDDGVDVVSLMMVWTKQSECKLSNLTLNCVTSQDTEDSMRALIAGAISETNAAYRLSDIDIQLKLVHAYRHPDYDESMAYGDGDYLNVGSFGATLGFLSVPFDGVMDDVPKLRRRYEADMVSMVVNDRTYCGIGYVGTGYFPYPTAPFMYSVNYVGCMTGRYVLAHELGHNFGCAHDRGTDNQCGPQWFYSAHGWRDPAGDFRTIMAYKCQRGQCDDNPASNCPTIPRFSDKNAEFNGKALGNRRNDCAKHIRRVAPLVSRFYGSEVQPCDPDNIGCQLQGILSGLFCFAPHMKAQVQGKGKVTMRDLQEGDRVLTAKKDGSQSYEKIYSINHYHHTQATDFLQLQVRADEEHKTVLLELSAMHMLFVKGQDYPIPAGLIQVGDYVQILAPRTQGKTNHTGGVQVSDQSTRGVYYASVEGVEPVIREGFYNPLTTGGTIVVNGIVASAYSSFLGLSPMLSTGNKARQSSMIISYRGALRLGPWSVISEQHFVHLLLSPYRVLSLLGLSRKRPTPSQQQDGDATVTFLSQFCYLGVVVLNWWQQQNGVIQLIMFLAILMVFGMLDATLNAVALIVEYPAASVILIYLSLWTAQATLSKKRNPNSGK